MSTLSWFSAHLLPWYHAHSRELPWREDQDPYRVWLSEVILQQTRVDQGMAYWRRFVERYPTVADLAEASEDEVLRLWQGLGYYSRARNLLMAAKQVVAEHEGRFPADHKTLLELKGIGDYTASAIASICFNIPEPVVDGNVYRVLSRVFAISTPIDSTEGRKEFRELAARLLDRQAPGDHNQAVMELGATVCTPKKPMCGSCPLASRCAGLVTERIAAFPVKAGRTAVRKRYFNYLHVRTHPGTFLRKRSGKDIWQGLYEFPLLETEHEMKSAAFAALMLKEFGKGWTITGRHKAAKHVLSHQVIHALFWEVDLPKRDKVPKDWIAVKEMDLEQYAVPRLMDRYLNAFGSE